MRISSQKSRTPPAGRTREPKRQRGRARVAALLDAAAAVFAARGYEAATTTEIAARAHAAIGSLYQFFPSKEALADALLRRYAARVEAALKAIEDRAANLPPAALADALVDLKLGLQTDRAAAMVLVERGGGAGRRAQFRQAMRRQLAAIFQTADARLPAARAAAMAVVVLQLLKLIPAVAEERPPQRQAILKEIRQLLRGYLAGNPPE